MILGIDLGTTYSVCAYLNSDGKPTILENSEGKTLTPSVVQIEGDHVNVGEIAKQNSIVDPENVISTVKNYMGQKRVFKVSSGEEHTPESISGLILKKIVKDASDKLNEKIEDVIITVPAYFTDAQREATYQAAKLAGLNMLGSINEPTAAALCYAHENHVTDANVLVYDLGGGTFDVTIVSIQKSNIEVRGTGGIANAGGHFFDDDIVKYVCGYMLEHHGIDLKKEEYKEELQELYIKAEVCKCQLGGREQAEIAVRVDGIGERVVISRVLFEGIVQKFYKRSESKMKSVLRESGMKIGDIDEILLVGGSSKIPYIFKKITEFYGREPSKQMHPDESVAKGAALYGQMIKPDEEHRIDSGQSAEAASTNARENKFSDVCSHSIGIVTVDERYQRRINSILIKKNTKLPANVTTKVKTYGNNSRDINLTLTEGEFEELEDVTILCDFPLELPGSVPRGTSVEIQIQLDEYQKAHIFVNIPSIGLYKEFHFERLNNLSDEDLEKLSGLVIDKRVD